MNQRDRVLLDKQVRRITPTPRHGGAVILAMVGIFLAGITLGDTLSAHARPMPAAAAAAAKRSPAQWPSGANTVSGTVILPVKPSVLPAFAWP